MSDIGYLLSAPVDVLKPKCYQLNLIIFSKMLPIRIFHVHLIIVNLSSNDKCVLGTLLERKKFITKASYNSADTDHMTLPFFFVSIFCKSLY